MALVDLIVTNKEISEDLIEHILKEKVMLIQDGHKVILTREGISYSNKIKILLFLAGGKAWELIDKINLSFSPSDMEKILNIPGNSLRPLLKELSDDYQIENTQGKYKITSKGIYELETLSKTSNNTSRQNTKKRRSNPSSKLKSTNNVTSKSKFLDELIEEDYFSVQRDSTEILNELGRRGIMIKPTSLPSYLLPLLRKRVLTRDYVLKNKRKVWAYMKK